MHFILLNIVKFIQGMDMSFPYPPSPHFSLPSTRSGIKATAGEGERGGSNPEGWPLHAPCDSHTHCVMAPGVPVSCRCPDDRPPLALLTPTGQPAACRKLGGCVCNPPAEHLGQAADACKVCTGLAAWARTQEHGRILNLELNGQKLVIPDLTKMERAAFLQYRGL